MSETATEQEAIAAANSAFGKFDTAFGTTVSGEQTLDAAFTKAIEVKTAANNQAVVDPTQYVPMAVYQEAVNQAGAAEAANKAKEINDLIDAACSDGRLTGQVTIAWYKQQAETNPDFVKAQLAALPKLLL